MLVSGGGESGAGTIKVWRLSSSADLDPLPKSSATDAGDASESAVAERALLSSVLTGHSHMVFALSAIGLDGVLASASMDTTGGWWLLLFIYVFNRDTS